MTKLSMSFCLGNLVTINKSYFKGRFLMLYNFAPKIFRFHSYALKTEMRVFKCCSLMAAAIIKSSVWLLLAWSLVTSSGCLAKSADVLPCGCALKKSLKLSPSRPQGWNHRWFLENDLGAEGNHYCHGDSLWGRKEGEKRVLPSFYLSILLFSENGVDCCAVLNYIRFLSTFFSFFAILSLWQNLCWKACQSSIALWITSLSRKYHFSHSNTYQRVSFQITTN